MHVSLWKRHQLTTVAVVSACRTEPGIKLLQKERSIFVCGVFEGRRHSAEHQCSEVFPSDEEGHLHYA